MSRYRVTANVLRIRSGPGTSFEVIGALFRNNVVQGDESSGDWVHIASTENKVGWSHGLANTSEVPLKILVFEVLQ